ncbi:MAG: hypothetical protein CL790_02045 [Chloroflexi bacterium]|nr:hypothetical protein [Chloroflexota bacterium]HCU74033.1 hypothetical protein [Chloroflexota bacterium]
MVHSIIDRACRKKFTRKHSIHIQNKLHIDPIFEAAIHIRSIGGNSDHEFSSPAKQRLTHVQTWPLWRYQMRHAGDYQIENIDS